MTGYEVGFLSKCAEYGVDVGTAMGLMEKSAFNWKMLGAYAKDIARHPGKAGRRWWELMRGGSKGMQRKAFDFRKALSDIDKDNTLSLTDRVIRKEQLIDALRNDKSFMSEAKKVIGTRLGTAAGTAVGTGTGVALLRNPKGFREGAAEGWNEMTPSAGLTGRGISAVNGGIRGGMKRPSVVVAR